MSTDRQALTDAVLQNMRDGNSLRKSCLIAGVKIGTFLDWVAKDAQLAEQYARAREILLEYHAEEILEIADEPVGSTESGGTDNGAVQKQKLKIDSRKWILSKLAPKKYGDKITQELTGPNGGPIQHQDVSDLTDEQLAAIANGQQS